MFACHVCCLKLSMLLQPSTYNSSLHKRHTFQIFTTFLSGGPITTCITKCINPLKAIIVHFLIFVSSFQCTFYFSFRRLILRISFPSFYLCLISWHLDVKNKVHPHSSHPQGEEKCFEENGFFSLILDCRCLSTMFTWDLKTTAAIPWKLATCLQDRICILSPDIKFCNYQDISYYSTCVQCYYLCLHHLVFLIGC